MWWGLCVCMWLSVLVCDKPVCGEACVESVSIWCGVCVYVCVFEGILCAYGGGCVCVQWDMGRC